MCACIRILFDYVLYCCRFVGESFCPRAFVRGSMLTGSDISTLLVSTERSARRLQLEMREAMQHLVHLRFIVFVGLEDRSWGE